MATRNLRGCRMLLQSLGWTAVLASLSGGSNALSAADTSKLVEISNITTSNRTRRGLQACCAVLPVPGNCRHHAAIANRVEAAPPTWMIYTSHHRWRSISGGREPPPSFHSLCCHLATGAINTQLSNYGVQLHQNWCNTQCGLLITSWMLANTSECTSAFSRLVLTSLHKARTSKNKWRTQPSAITCQWRWASMCSEGWPKTAVQR